VIDSILDATNQRILAALSLLVLSGATGLACDGSPGTPLGDASAGDSGAAADASTDTGAPMPEACDALAPRTPPAEVFMGPAGLRARLLALFESAETSLDAATCLLDDPALIDALGAAAARGVEVRVLLDPDQGVNLSARTALAARGVDARFASRMFEHYHPKTLIIDRRLAVVMSANLNGFSMESERNHGVLLRDADDVTDVEALFELDFSDGSAPASLNCTRLLIAPNNARGRLQTLVDSATTTLELQHLSFSDPAMRRRVMARATAGVSVRVLLADPDWITGNASAASALRSAGVEVRFLRSLENHAKLILVDGATAMVGSENLSSTSLDQNREVGVLSSDAAAYTALSVAFEGDWASSGE
jgi:phosphatidylserine/phosphatidylglycerophosphate/cardiolipin synthase-like enzyme